MVISIPDVIGIVIIGVQPLIVVIVLDVEHIRIAVRVHIVQDTFHDHCPLNILRAVFYLAYIML